MTVPPEKIAFVDIYPPIGIARVGDSDEYYLGPEIPGVEPIQKNGFKDSQHRIKKQAVRFRVYAYGEDSQLLGELTDGKEYALEWTVHVANKKAAWVKFRGRYEDEEWNLRNPEVQPWPKNTEPTYEYTDQRDQLIIDSGEQRVSKISQQPVPLQGQFCNARPDEKKEPVDVNLGSLLTDEHGRLVFLPSNGDSFCTRDSNRHPDLESEMDNNDWVDSTCDGTVKVAVKSHESPETKIKLRNKATIITAPPKFTPGIQSVTSLLDLIEDIYENQDRKEDYKGCILSLGRTFMPHLGMVCAMPPLNLV
ncbi:L-lysine 6-oxidase OS=Marinomonas mediterranea (strain ATCC 700492 / JCM 21426 / NBRC 103028 / MMB-1) GN=lodA PE=1 SV=1 [Rhizoctonia solani AG-1 IB]|uniref:L-lysine 6-oxidase n=1 Tax=Thanatephorus cucumeris (strain AG1-IB / isolate 7/3/14) TaxID=1108050 RepID=A0A0B7FFD4_THACB|nr:L-lysine 6-oxidase OS=Marinomonas mediterranea (strain ATCC 700492 / JCM 21426 / NBRC 103028 / MMB-1) GN=lodA PE=1 SV=1 [Rhizoctonia solani AG-1 IB]